MSGPQGVPSLAPQQPKSLAGTLAKTPVSRLLMSASTARVTGTLDLTNPETGETASVVFVRGAVTKVQNSVAVAYLGSVLYELGFIDSETLNTSLRELSRVKWLHGEILLTRAAITQIQLVEGLSEQTTRKLAHLFTLGPATTYAFESEVDRLASWGGGADWPHVDPMTAVWRGVRDGFAAADIEAAFLRQGDRSAYRLVGAIDAKRLDLTHAELSAVECLRARALTLDELASTGLIDVKRTRELVYFLMVTKRAEALETSGVRPAYRPSAAAAPVPGARPSLHAPGTTPSIGIPRGSDSGRWRAVAPPPSARLPAAEPARVPVNPGVRSLTPPAMPAVRSIAPGQVLRPTAAPGPVPVSQTGKQPAFTPSRAGTQPAFTPSRTGTQPPFTPSRAGTQPPLMPSAPASSRSVTPPAPAPESVRSMSVAPPPSSDRVTLGGVKPTAPPPRNLSVPPLGQPQRTVSTGTFNARVVAELAGRRQSIADRAQQILKEDYFQRLSLPKDARSEQVEQAFAALQTLWDPELLPPALGPAKDDCAFVMSCLVEAYSTLRDQALREEYAQKLTLAALRGPPDNHGEDLAISGKEDAVAGAEACFAKGDVERAERLARRAVKNNHEAAPALALLAWIEANKPTNASPEETKKRIAVLDRAIRLDDTLQQAWYWRGMLHKRLENHHAALTSFRRLIELNAKHIDALRELRVYEMRSRKNS
jgi:hypothetical protein